MQPTATVLVYSDNAGTREQVRLATGRRPATDVPEVGFMECATLPAVLKELDHGGIDVCVLDGEAAPGGGWASAGRSRTRSSRRPPVLLLIGRPQDAWLATWSRAEAAVTLPVEPVEFAGALAALLRDRRPWRPEGPQGRPSGPVTTRGAHTAAWAPSCVPDLRASLTASLRLRQTAGRSLAASAAVGPSLAPESSALPLRHFFQPMFQSPRPLPKVGMSSPELLTTFTRSPWRTVS